MSEGDMEIFVGVTGWPTVTVAVLVIVVPVTVAITLNVCPTVVFTAETVKRPSVVIVPALEGIKLHVTSWEAPAGDTDALKSCCPPCATTVEAGNIVTLVGSFVPMGVWVGFLHVVKLRMKINI